MTLRACPACGTLNEATATFCVNCNTPLMDAEPIKEDGTSDTIRTLDDLPSPPPPMQHIAVKLEPDAVALYIDDSAEPLVVHITRQAILGRYSPHSTSQPRIDLTQFGAYDKGISRLHAVLRRTVNGLTLEDLGSSNGTWVGEMRLLPYTAQLLHSGDRIRLGQIFIEVVFSLEGQTNENRPG